MKKHVAITVDLSKVTIVVASAGLTVVNVVTAAGMKGSLKIVYVEILPEKPKNPEAT